jgi:hypothetical protein
LTFQRDKNNLNLSWVERFNVHGSGLEGFEALEGLRIEDQEAVIKLIDGMIIKKG